MYKYRRIKVENEWVIVSYVDDKSEDLKYCYFWGQSERQKNRGDPLPRKRRLDIVQMDPFSYVKSSNLDTSFAEIMNKRVKDKRSLAFSNVVYAKGGYEKEIVQVALIFGVYIIFRKLFL